MEAHSAIDILGAGLLCVLTALNAWFLFLAQGIKDDIKALYRRADDISNRQAAHELKVATENGDRITRKELKESLSEQTIQLKEFILSRK